MKIWTQDIMVCSLMRRIEEAVFYLDVRTAEDVLEKAHGALTF